MSKVVCIIFLLATLLAVISTPAAAAGLEKKWNNQCCPIALCVFKKGSNFEHRRKTKRNTNLFDGFMQFTETFDNQLYISGFLDVEHVKKEVPADNLNPEFDVHINKCNDVSFNNIEEGLDLDDVDDIFDLPFVKVVKNKKVEDVVDKCCIVAKDVGNKHQVLGVAKVKQAVKCNPNNIVLGSDFN
ncbi:9498_t:CDS:1 [Paraglomus brasilianum]|uniref:9498_t:CDS:1 n=1 Tax=Paraglomus brasilianum TaxID=144538 RepID=A0A9N9G478_9GLOM|nr:9498_t:CDS:1 [Paraglomus brasilianum]